MLKENRTHVKDVTWDALLMTFKTSRRARSRDFTNGVAQVPKFMGGVTAVGGPIAFTFLVSVITPTF